jgi:CheY-like chemotaxis protein
MITEEKSNTTAILVDNSTIDNFVNSKIIVRYKLADNVLVFTKSAKALKYLLELNTTTTEKIPSILFLDLDMPEINGFEFLNAFNFLPDKIKKRIKIVILTNSSNPSDTETCCEHDSVIAFFQKPLIKSNIDTLELLLSNKDKIPSLSLV